MIRPILIILCSLSGTLFAQSFDQSIADKVDLIEGANTFISQYEELGVKESGSDELYQTASWLEGKLMSFGYQLERDSFTDQWSRLHINIRCTREGVSNKGLIVGAHYDSRAGVGANDNGTGVYALVEIARIISDINFEHDIELIFFSGEEDGFLGSSHHVQKVQKKGASDVFFMLNLDQLGGTKGKANEKIFCERDEDDQPFVNNAASAKYTDTLAELTKLYSDLEPVISGAFASDYVPFEDDGYTIMGLYQFEDYPFYHTQADSLDKIDTNSTLEATKIALAAVLYFGAIDTSGSTRPTIEKDRIQILPNPVHSFLTIRDNKSALDVISIFDSQARLVLKKRAENHFEEQLNLSEFSPDIYSVTIQTSQGNLLRKKIVLLH